MHIMKIDTNVVFAVDCNRQKFGGCQNLRVKCLILTLPDSRAVTSPFHSSVFKDLSVPLIEAVVSLSMEAPVKCGLYHF